MNDLSTAQPDAISAGAGVFSGQLAAQQASALQLKLQSSLIQQQLQGQQRIEQEKFAREQTLSPTVANTLLDSISKPRSIMGITIPGIDTSNVNRNDPLTIDDANQLQSLYKDQAQRVMGINLRSPLGSSPTYDPTGVLTGTTINNVLGVPIQHIPTPGADAKIPQATRLQQFSGNLDRQYQLYNQLSSTGGGLMQLPANLFSEAGGGSYGMGARNELLGSLASTKVLQGELIDQVPGGRASLGLGKGQEAAQLAPGKDPDVAKNVYDNTRFQVYRSLKLLGPTVKIPQSLAQDFANIPRDTSGVPTNVLWRAGEAFLPGSDTPLDLSNPPTPSAQGDDVVDQNGNSIPQKQPPSAQPSGVPAMSAIQAEIQRRKQLSQQGQ